MNSSPLHRHFLDAWKLTTHAVKIRRFNFFGSLIDTFILSEILLIQISHVWLDVLGRSSEFFSWVRETALLILWGGHRMTWIGGVLVLGLFYFLATFVLKNMFNAGLIYLIKSYTDRDEKSYKTLKAVTFWWRKSVKLAEYHSLLFWSKPVYVAYIFGWGYSLLDGNWTLISLIALVFMCVLIVTRFFFEYARYFIIVQDEWVFSALGLSLTIAIENFGMTVRLFFSLILVYLRELVLLVGIFFFPFLMSWLVALGLGPIFLQGVFVILGLVYFSFLIIVSAMNSVIEIFVESLWFSVFRENNSSHASHSHHSSHH